MITFNAHRIKQIDTFVSRIEKNSDKTAYMQLEMLDENNVTVEVSIFFNDKIKINGEEYDVNDLQKALDILKGWKTGEVSIFDKEGGQL